MPAVLRRWWLLPLALLLLIVWGPALTGPFQFDDHAVIVNYGAVHSLSAWWDAQPGIRPLLKLSYALNWTLDPAPFGFHLVNLLLHALNAVLLLAWLRRVLPAGRQSELPLLAPLATLLWLLHPVTTEAVTYISGRSVLFSSTFMLAALLALAGDHRRAPWWAAVFTLLALAVRETAWVLPLLLLLVEWLRGRSTRVALQRTAPAFVVVVLLALAALLEPGHQRMLQVSLGARDLGTQLWTQPEAWRWLLQQALLLQAPNMDPDIPVRTGATPLLIAQLLLWLGVAAVALWRVLAARSWLAGGVLWFFLVLAPTNSLLPRLDVANDRHLYLALAGPLLAAVFLAMHGLRRVRAPIPAVVAVLVLLAFAAATFSRNLDYTSEVSLWQRTAQQSPGKSRVWNNLGMACQQAGDTECARAAFDQALELDPDNTRAAVNRYFLDR